MSESNWDKNLLSSLRGNSRFGKWYDMKTCVENGANINYCEEYTGWTPLLTAINNRSLQHVEFLISRGADINNVGRHGTPLTFSISLEHWSIAKYLVEKGANVCKPDTKGRTPLSWATENKNVDMVQFLLDHGAKFTSHAALLDAIRCEQFKIANILLESGANPNVNDSNGNCPLIKCIERGIESSYVDLLSQFVKYGADVNMPDDNGTFALTKSAEIGSLQMVKILVENGARLNVKDRKGESPFYKALHGERFEVVKYLVERGENVNRVFDNNECPLSISASKSDIQTFDFLVNSGANINLALEKIEKIAEEDVNIKFYIMSLKQKKKKHALLGGTGHEDWAFS